eukprot:1196267-Prorocentrum_minimum.AAC.5
MALGNASSSTEPCRAPCTAVVMSFASGSCRPPTQTSFIETTQVLICAEQMRASRVTLDLHSLAQICVVSW